MLTCPFCQTDLSDDGIEAGRCFSCGGLVMWQDEYTRRGDVSNVASTVTNVGVSTMPQSQPATMMFGGDGASLAGSAPQQTILLDHDSVSSSDSRVSAGRNSQRSDSGSSPIPPVEPPQGNDEQRPDDNSLKTIDGFRPSDSVRPLSPVQLKQMQTVWQLSGNATPRTSLKAPSQNVLDSAQVQRLQTLWQGSPSAVAGGRDSRGTDGQRKSQRRSTLVIGARALQDVNEPHNRDADYELLDQIGEGGMGIVYEARQACMDRVVAVKMLHKRIASDLDQREKFLSEAVITAELDHPNIVPIHDLGSNEAGDLFYSMKRVQGTPWSDGVSSKPQNENLEILLKVCDAIAFAHQRGVIHRDLKPENIMLGDFGEVLVMDWGLAMPTSEFRRSESISQGCSMGGTPAYMAPEMATGPIDAIGKHSDVYLLGAILFEIISGETPHTGKDTMDCLYAAARNDIQPTSETGELLEIALQAMATRIEKRHSSVQDFQTAIRAYQAHEESITLSNRAATELRKARESNDYQEYASALYGYKEALALWGGNTKAAAGLKEAALAYATCAVDKKDFDLAASLLDPAEPRHRDLGRTIDVERRERDSRVQRLRHLRLFAVVMAAVLFGTVFNAYIWIQRDRDAAVSAKNFAQQTSDKLAVNLKELEIARTEEQTQKQAAMTALRDAEEARAAKEYESYLAQMQLVNEKIEANAYREAMDLLEASKDSSHKNWEWGRSKYLCREFAQRWNTLGRVEDVAIAPNGTTFGAVCGGGFAWVWSTDDSNFVQQLSHDGTEVISLAFTHDSQGVITGDAKGSIRIFNTSTGECLVQLKAHDAEIVSLAIAPEVHRMISSSYDKTIIVWDITDVDHPVALQRYQRHAFVLDIDITSDGETFVTGGQDGYALVWKRNREAAGIQYDPVTQFTAHEGAVYAVAIAPDGHNVVSGGYDKRVLVWDLRNIKPINLHDIANNIASEPPPYRPLDGHHSPVQSVAFSPDGTRIVSGSMDNTLRIWDAVTGELYKTLRGHAYGVRTCIFSHDGTSILSGSHDKTVRLWKVGDYREVRLLNAQNLSGHDDAVMSARYSNDGRFIVTSSRDRSAVVWDTVEQQAICRLEEGHDYMATNVRFFPDGTKLLTGGGDNTVRVWNVVAGSELLRLEQTGRNGVVALDYAGERLATGDAENIHIWDVAAGTRINTLVGHNKNIASLGFSHDGTMLVSGDTNGGIVLWKLGQSEPLWSTRGHSTMVTASHFLPGDQRVITSSGDHTVTQWDVATGNEVPQAALAHPGWVSHLLVTPDGKQAVTVCDDSVVRLWDLDRATVAGTFDAPSSADTLAYNLQRAMRTEKWSTEDLAAEVDVPVADIQSILQHKSAPDTQLLADIARTLHVPLTALTHPKVEGISLSQDGTKLLTSMSKLRACRLWDVSTQKEVLRGEDSVAPTLQPPYLQLASGILWSAAFSPDSQQVATIGGNEVRLWSFETGKQEMTFSPHGTVASAAFSPNGENVVTAGWDFSAKIWHAQTGIAQHKLIGGHTNRINDCVYSPSGEIIATASDDGTVRFWNAMTGELLPLQLTGHSDAILTVRYSTDGTTLVTASRDRTARIWDATTGNQIAVLVDGENNTSHQLGVLCAEFFETPEKALRIITGSEDATAKVWDASTFACLKTLQGHIGPITCVTGSPDGERVVTGSRDATAKLWDPDTGKEVITLTGHERDITSISFSPSGRDVLTSSLDGMAIVWPSEPWNSRQNSP